MLVVGWLLWRTASEYPGSLRVWGGLLVVLVAQAIVGEVQYRNALPWGLVLVHVALAAAIWAFSLALAFVALASARAADPPVGLVDGP